MYTIKNIHVSIVCRFILMGRVKSFILVGSDFISGDMLLLSIFEVFRANQGSTNVSPLQ